MIMVINWLLYFGFGGMGCFWIILWWDIILINKFFLMDNYFIEGLIYIILFNLVWILLNLIFY